MEVVATPKTHYAPKTFTLFWTIKFGQSFFFTYEAYSHVVLQTMDGVRPNPFMLAWGTC